MIGWAVGANIITSVASLPIAFLILVGVGMGDGDAARMGTPVVPMSVLDQLGVFLVGLGVFNVGTVPSWVLVYFRKPLPALLLSLPACVLALGTFLLLAPAFR